MSIKQNSNTPFKGVYTALVTPMTPDGEVDYNTLGSFIDHMIDQGLHGIIPLGSTGEFYALTDVEREKVVRATIEAVDHRVPVVVGANASSTQKVVEYSRQAEQAGADGLLLAPPYYSLPTMDELFEHFRTVNDAVGIPIMLYNYPGRAGVDMLPEFIESLAALENVKYVKESTGDVTRVSEIIRRCGDQLEVFCGGDTVALESFALGATGWVGGIANVLPAEHVELYNRCVVQQDLESARAYYYEILPKLDLIENSGKYTQFVKAGCAIKGYPVGSPRMPLLPATPAEVELLTAGL